MDCARKNRQLGDLYVLIKSLLTLTEQSIRKEWGGGGGKQSWDRNHEIPTRSRAICLQRITPGQDHTIHSSIQSQIPKIQPLQDNRVIHIRSTVVVVVGLVGLVCLGVGGLGLDLRVVVVVGTAVGLVVSLPSSSGSLPSQSPRLQDFAQCLPIQVWSSMHFNFWAQISHCMSSYRFLHVPEERRRYFILLI